MRSARDSQILLSFLNDSASPIHMTSMDWESLNRASTFEEKADSNGNYSGGSDARDGAG